MVTPSRMGTATSFSSTMSVGRARNMGVICEPAGKVRIPGSNPLKTPYLSPGSSGWDGTNTFSGWLTCTLPLSSGPAFEHARRYRGGLGAAQLASDVLQPGVDV